MDELTTEKFQLDEGGTQTYQTTIWFVTVTQWQNQEFAPILTYLECFIIALNIFTEVIVPLIADLFDSVIYLLLHVIDMLNTYANQFDANLALVLFIWNLRKAYNESKKGNNQQ